MSDAQGSEAKRLVETWKLVSLVSNYPDGRTIEHWGKPMGRISYDGSGNVIALLMHEHRNQAGGIAADQEALSSYSAYFGTYRIDEAERTVRHQVIACLNPDASGELKRSFAFEDGMLILGFATTREGVTVTRRLQWRRVSG